LVNTGGNCVRSLDQRNASLRGWNRAEKNSVAIVGSTYSYIFPIHRNVAKLCHDGSGPNHSPVAESAQE
jgi:hypothetical protein